MPFTWGRAVPYLLTVPLLVYMAVFYVLPVLSMLLRSVTEPDWTLAHYASLADDTVFLKVFWNTLYTAVIVTLGTLLLGYPVALALVRTRGATAAIILIVILLPFWTSVLVRSYAWMVLLGRHGLIAQQVDQVSWAYASCLSAVLLAIALVIIAGAWRLPGVGNAFRIGGR